MSATRAIGIDLGTTNSCVGAFVKNDVVIFENYEGDRTTASYVAFTDCERIIGNAAKSRVVGDPSGIVHCAKRLIGRKFHDTSIQKDIRNFAFKVTKGAADRPMIEVPYQGAAHQFYAEEISAMVIGNLKETAERKVNAIVNDAVITVPAYFTDAQRQATIDAARIAGLNVLRLINEPTAAALAYGIGHAGDEPRTVLIYDLGGGTFDVSIVRVSDHDCDVLSTAGDTHLGGEDFDDLLVEHFAKVLNEKYNCDTFNKPKARRRLRLKCEEAKRALSSNVQAPIEVDLFEDDYSCTVNRAQFEGLCGDQIRGTLSIVEQCVKEASLSTSDIDHVLLVGGSTRIPLVQKVLSEFFGGKTLNLSLNPDEAVAYGAALLAAKLTRRRRCPS